MTTPFATLTRRRLLASCAALPLLASSARAAGRKFFVSPKGSDQNPGTELSPFLTIGAVFRHVTDLGAGDTIVVKPGTYQEAVVVTAGGDATGNLTIISETPRAALIRSPASSYSALAIVKNYVTIDGFDVRAGGTGHAIEATFIDGNNRNNGPHHITVRNCVCHDSAGSGISFAYGDFYLIENNVCYNNCATNQYQGSGISVYSARAVDGPTGTRIVVRNNTSYRNMAITLPGDAPHSDGNGIIIDDLRNTQTGYAAGAYPYSTLVENNVCYANGGKGIHVYISNNVTVRNNTCCYNNRDLKNPATWRGELSNVNSNNCMWVNNIGVADRVVNSYNAAVLDASYGGPINSNVTWLRNLCFDGRTGSVALIQAPTNPTLTTASPYRNILGSDPRFVKAGASEPNPDFHLRSGSPAVDAGVTTQGISATDRDGHARIFGTAPDLGAYEYGSS